MLQDAMKLLNFKGGKLVNVDASFLEFKEFLRDDIDVRIEFHEKAASGLYQRQETFFAVDPSSWGTLHDGLNGLSYKFADAIQRTYTDNEVPHPHWKNDYAEFMAKVEKRRLAENKL